MTYESTPGAKSPGYLLSGQSVLIGAPGVTGFGTDVFDVREIERDLANEIITREHYSHKIVNTSYVHLGLVIEGELMGVLQFGYAMNPASGATIVPGTGNRDYLELNRMWLDDRAPRNSESRAIGYAVKFIRRAYPRVRWLQSFADERCGLFGTVYQAAGFKFYGEHVSTFWELDGEVFHNIIMTDTSRRQSVKARHLIDNRHRAKQLVLRQFRYLRFMQPRFARRCTLREQPFPKPDHATRLERQPGSPPGSEV
ncbi:MAG: hypothetical protein KIT02_10220 [Devosia sp.]|uniref:Mom family adenine methylcarbamoylation protein n=1 Tax=Devosia sp. TaxID=1871048 RepID=UPI0024C5AAA6|nr:hypothetical protein [Devosia sp.]UYN98341.1 MAG: hypothetical protein KIT02_10220 [Devosia sp.]